MFKLSRDGKMNGPLLGSYSQVGVPLQSGHAKGSPLAIMCGDKAFLEAVQTISHSWQRDHDCEQQRQPVCSR
jgi:hypothetical protein